MPCAAVCLDCSNNILFVLDGISHGFDITHDLLVLAWNFKDILRLFFSDLYRYYTLPIKYMLYT